MTFFFCIFFFFLGLAVGSFLNVVALRYGAESSLGGRSKCPSCHTQLSWKELIPLFSFIVQKGKCRTCRTNISWQYPVVELGTAILFVLVFLKISGFSQDLFFISYIPYFSFYFLVISLFVVITVYDYHHKIIPDVFVYTLVVLGGIELFVSFSPLAVVSPSLWHVLAGPILFAPFALLWLVSSGRWMGFGDAKLAFAIGWLLGLRAGITAIVFAFWIGALYFLLVLLVQRVTAIFNSSTLTTERESGTERVISLRSRTRDGSKTFALSGKRLTMKSEVPFGPFLVLGTFVVFFTNVELLALISLFI